MIMLRGFYFIVALGWATSAFAQDGPPPCKDFLYCTFLGQTLNDPGCWCHWDNWRHSSPVPWWWNQRQSRPDWMRHHRGGGPGWQRPGWDRGGGNRGCNPRFERCGQERRGNDSDRGGGNNNRRR